MGIYNSQFAVKNIAVSKKRKTTMFEIELPIEEGGISYIDDHAMPIKPNMVICAKPGQIRHTKFPYKCYFVHMILHGDLLYDTLIRLPDYMETDQAENCKNIFTKLIRYSDPGENNEIMLQSLVLELIYTISHSQESRREYRNQGNSNMLRIEKALKYVNDNLTEELDLEQVSAHVSLSPIHFHNVFKASVGKTLREYVEQQRINKAIHLLMTTDASLTEIAFECGFSSQSYFSYVFKRRMHQTPREYIHDIYRKYEM